MKTTTMKETINPAGIRPGLLRIVLSLLILNFIFLFQNVQGQNAYKSIDISQASMLGSSNTGNWAMSTIDMECSSLFSFDEADQLIAVKNFSFSLDAVSLSSINNNIDQLVHNAFNAAQHPKITYTLDSAIILKDSPGKYTIRAIGLLNIAGKQQPAAMDLTANINFDKTVNLTGLLKLKLSDYAARSAYSSSGVKVKSDVSLVLNLLFQNEPMLVMRNNTAR